MLPSLQVPINKNDWQRKKKRLLLYTSLNNNKMHRRTMTENYARIFLNIIQIFSLLTFFQKSLLILFEEWNLCPFTPSWMTKCCTAWSYYYYVINLGVSFWSQYLAKGCLIRAFRACCGEKCQQTVDFFLLFLEDLDIFQFSLQMTLMTTEKHYFLQYLRYMPH